MNYRKRKILFIQNDLTHYRLPFYEHLRELFGVITICHVGKPCLSKGSKLKEVILNVKSFLGFNFQRGLKPLIDDNDVIVAMFDLRWPVIWLSVLLKKNSNFLLWGHGLGSSRSFIVIYLRKIVATRAKGIIFYSEKGAEEFIKNTNISSKKCFVAPNTISIPNFIDTSDRHKDSFIYVGRLQERKKLHLALEGFKNAGLYEKGLIFRIIGDGEEERRRLAELAENLGIVKSVEFIPGTVDENILLSYFEKAYAYLSPGAVGLGVLHSFSYGVPVITIEDTHHGPEVGDIKQMVNGFITHGYNEFCDFLKNTSTTKYRLMGNNAFNFYKNNRQIIHMVGSFGKAIKDIK